MGSVTTLARRTVPDQPFAGIGKIEVHETDPAYVGKQTGGPRLVPTKSLRRTVSLLAASGHSYDDICGLLINPLTGRPLTVAALKKLFPLELRSGHVWANARVVKALHKSAVDGNVPAQVWWTKARMGWKDETLVSHQSPSGGPVEVEARIKLEANSLMSKLINLTKKNGEYVPEANGAHEPTDDASAT